MDIIYSAFVTYTEYEHNVVFELITDSISKI